MWQHDYVATRTMLDQSLSTFSELQDLNATASNLASWSYLLQEQGHHEQAVLLLAATYGHVRESGQWHRIYTAINERRLDSARAVIGVDRFEDAWQRGLAMSQDEALVYLRQHKNLPDRATK
jgi:hypothetical protein